MQNGRLLPWAVSQWFKYEPNLVFYLLKRSSPFKNFIGYWWLLLNLCKDLCKPFYAFVPNWLFFKKNITNVLFVFSFIVLVPEPTGQIKKRRRKDDEPVQLVKPVWASCQKRCAFWETPESDPALLRPMETRWMCTNFLPSPGKPLESSTTQSINQNRQTLLVYQVKPAERPFIASSTHVPPWPLQEKTSRPREAIIQRQFT